MLMRDGSARPPVTTKVFLPIDEQDEGDNLVSYELLHHGDVSTLLRALDFQALDDRGKVDRIARQVAKDYEDDGAADSLWRLSRALPLPEMLSIIGDRLDVDRLRVRSKDGRWRPTADVWLPNGLIPTGSIGDEHLLVDDLFHRQDLNLLKNLGLRSTLPEPATMKDGPAYDFWKSAEAARISAESRNSPVPVSEASLRFRPAMATAGLHLLAKASIRTRKRSRRGFSLIASTSPRWNSAAPTRLPRSSTGQTFGGCGTTVSFKPGWTWWTSNTAPAPSRGFLWDSFPIPGQSTQKSLNCRTPSRPSTGASPCRWPKRSFRADAFTSYMAYWQNLDCVGRRSSWSNNRTGPRPDMRRSSQPLQRTRTPISSF